MSNFQTLFQIGDRCFWRFARSSFIFGLDGHFTEYWAVLEAIFSLSISRLCVSLYFVLLIPSPGVVSIRRRISVSTRAILLFLQLSLITAVIQFTRPLLSLCFFSFFALIKYCALSTGLAYFLFPISESREVDSRLCEKFVVGRWLLSPLQYHKRNEEFDRVYGASGGRKNTQVLLRRLPWT